MQTGFLFDALRSCKYDNINYFFNYIRRNEFSADRYSYETTNNKDALISMLKGLAANNLSHLTPHPLKVFLSYSHPPVLARIKAIEEL